MKKAIFILSSSALLIVWGFLAYQGFLKVNQYRLDQSKALLEKSKSEPATKNKLILLLQSNVLESTEEKLTEISKIYLATNRYEEAERYLRKIKSQNGYANALTAAIEYGDERAVDRYLSLLKEGPEKEEINIFLMFSKGKSEALSELPEEPITDAGLLLKAINTFSFEEIGNSSIAAEAGYGKNLSKSEVALTLAEIFINRGHHKIAQYVLSETEERFPGVAEVYLLRARSYFAEGDSTKALEEQKRAIESDPSNLSYYKKALIYAQAGKNEIEISAISGKIDYLNKINK